MYSVIIQYISFIININMKSRPITNMFVVIKPLNKIIILAIYIKVSLGCVNFTQPSYAEYVV